MEEERGSNSMTYIVIAAVLLALGVGGFFGWRYLNSQSQQAVSVTPGPSLTPTSQPTQEPKTPDRASISFEVLNGSGVSGGAKKAADKLTSLGYAVVKVGNADKSTYVADELFIRTEKRDQSDLILADLKSDFKISSVSGELTEGTASARLIIGKEN